MAEAKAAKNNSPKKKGVQRIILPKIKQVVKKVVVEKVVVEEVVEEAILLPTTIRRTRRMPARFIE